MEDFDQISRVADAETLREDGTPIDLDDPALYANRELSLLEFQERVLGLAEDPSAPLLERVRYLAIVSSNLAEFYMVRMAGMRQQVAAGVSDVSPDGLSSAEQLEASQARALELLHRGRLAYVALKAELADEGIHLLGYDELDESQRREADEYYREVVFPVLTPLAFDPGRPFPHISNQSLNLAVLVCDPDGEERFARVKLPRSIPRFVTVPPPAQGGPDASRPSREHHLVFLEDVVTAHLPALFPGMDVLEADEFKVTRDAEVAIQELEADDLLETIEEGVRKRRFGSVVRVTITEGTPPFVREILQENLEIAPPDMVALAPPLGVSDLFELYKLDRPDLKYPPFAPALSPDLQGKGSQDLFAEIREKDVLLHRPFESFQPVVRLIQQAARDPEVLAIKMTLYRVGKDSPIVEALLAAAIAGKEVTALVELKARFDEESNIEWARALEAEGVHVVYGLVGLKTHSKIALIVRREGRHIRRYLHVGTGNYNVQTARQYTDLDLLTTDEAMCDDATHLFNYLTGYAVDSHFDTFLVAPIDLRRRFEQLAHREMEHARAGRGGRMILKMNSLADSRMVRLLYEAAMAGCEIDLIVRGICTLRPGIPGVSERVRVRSIVGRFLEHSRIYWFANAGDPECLVGSADLMPRNLERRVEVVAPVRDPAIVARLHDEILAAYLADDVRARVMRPDGSYVPVESGSEAPPFDAQAKLLTRTHSEDERAGSS